LFAQ
jgi:hypothetical protein